MATLNNAPKLTADYDKAVRYVVGGNPMDGRPLASVALTHNTRIGPSRFAASGIGVTYHGTEIVTLLPDGGMRLNTGGYWTVTTIRRINAWLHAAGLPFTAGTVKYALKLTRTTDRDTIDWTDGVTVYPHGLAVGPDGFPLNR